MKWLADWFGSWFGATGEEEPVRRIIVYGWERRKKKKRKLDARTVAMWAVGSGAVR